MSVFPGANGPSHKTMLAIALGLALTGLPAQAHHMKGLPHFGYKDMGWYPQIPSKETIRRVKDLLIIATTMPGDPKAGAQVNIHLYVKELTANQPLSVPIHYSITRKTLFFFTESVRPRSELRPILELYQIATTFPKGGNYTLTLHLPNQALTTIPIKVTP